MGQHLASGTGAVSRSAATRAFQEQPPTDKVSPQLDLSVTDRSPMRLCPPGRLTLGQHLAVEQERSPVPWRLLNQRRASIHCRKQSPAKSKRCAVRVRARARHARARTISTLSPRISLITDIPKPPAAVSTPAACPWATPCRRNRSSLLFRCLFLTQGWALLAKDKCAART